VIVSFNIIFNCLKGLKDIMEKIKNVPKNDVFDLLEVGPLPAEANL
jgi:hypothetical protein